MCDKTGILSLSGVSQGTRESHVDWSGALHEKTMVCFLIKAVSHYNQNDYKEGSVSKLFDSESTGKIFWFLKDLCQHFLNGKQKLFEVVFSFETQANSIQT